MTKSKIISFRVDDEDYNKIDKQRKVMGFKNVAAFFIHIWDRFKREQKI